MRDLTPRPRGALAGVPACITSPEGIRNYLESRRLVRAKLERERAATADRQVSEYAAAMRRAQPGWPFPAGGVRDLTGAGAAAAVAQDAVALKRSIAAERVAQAAEALL
jgi:hypothetical protein